MANESSESNEKSRFGGIYKGLAKILMNDSYLEEVHTNTPTVPDKPVAVTTPAQAQSPAMVPSTPVVFVSQPVGSDVDKMIQKIHGVLEGMNQPGIDFLELWESAEAMGGITEQNLSASFKVLKIASGNTLRMETILLTGNFYVTELKKQIGDGIAQKQQERQKLVDGLKSEKESLVTEIASLEQQIKNLQITFGEKQTKLNTIESTYVAPMATIDQKIKVGTVALNQVVNQLQSGIDLLSTIKI